MLDPKQVKFFFGHIAHPLLLMLPICFGVSWGATAWAESPVIRLDRVELIKSSRRSELGVNIEATVSGISAEELSRCLARTDRPINRQLPPQEIFRPVSFNSSEVESLQECSSEHCDYEFPHALADRLANSPSLAGKKQAYFGLAYQLSFADKKKKEHRIFPYQIKEPCTDHGAFHWLLNGKIKPFDKLVWRKFGPSKRMEPTLMTLQVSRWQAGDQQCLGKTLLFADHYYDDHLELYQLRREGEVVKLSYHSRSRFDFFDSWWARRFRGTISRGLRDYQRRQLVRDVTRCAERVLSSR